MRCEREKQIEKGGEDEDERATGQMKLGQKDQSYTDIRTKAIEQKLGQKD